MAPVRFNPDDVASVLPPGGRTLVLGCSGESRILADAVMRAGPALGAMTFTGIFVPGLNRHTYLANPACRVETFFLTPQLKAAGAAVEFLPLCYGDILARLRTIKVDAALFMAAEPDSSGACSFGPVVDFLAELWSRIPVRIAHINPLTPRTRGHSGIPFSDITAFTECEQPLLGLSDASGDATSDLIAKNVAGWVVDGATLQTGIGKVPAAVFGALKGRRNLRIHSGLIGDAILPLQEAGALAEGSSVTAGVAIGSERLYEAIGGPTYNFQPVSFTHAPAVVSGIEKFVAINSAIEVDLLGQSYAEMGPSGLMSGPGGASDFARAAWSAGGLRIVALPASAAKGAVSRIVAPNAGAGPVSLGRMDTDIVVTEFGSADLRGQSHQERARALIAIAPADHRKTLEETWTKFAARF
jgi:acyl-CoA hydrolase